MRVHHQATGQKSTAPRELTGASEDGRRGPPPSAGRKSDSIPRQAFAAILDFLLPPACSFCAAPLIIDADHDGIRLCESCRDGFTRDTRPACRKCGMPTGLYVDTTDGCIACRRRRFRFETVIRLGVYEDSLRTACIRGKSPGTEALAAALGALLFNERREQFEAFAPDVVVPVPQYWLHLLTRPHHQAHTIAVELARHLGIPCLENAVRKVRRTRDQSSLPRSKRLKNLHEAFRIRKRYHLKGRRVLVVDDILTTGTTSNEVTRALRRAGASSVAIAVLAVVD